MGAALLLLVGTPPFTTNINPPLTMRRSKNKAAGPGRHFARGCAIFATVLLLNLPALAQPTLLPGLGEADARQVVAETAAPWSALGRVQTELGGRCTGALLGPRTVLTAAHCLVAPRSRKLVQPRSVHFLRGYHLGQWQAEGRAIRFKTGPGFDPARRGPTEADWAVLTLDRDVAGSVPSLVLERHVPSPGTPLMLGGYQQDRPELLLADRACHLLGVSGRRGAARLLWHDCAGTRGASGAPLLAQRASGEWAVLGIAVAVAKDAPRGLAVPAAALPESIGQEN